MALPIGKLTVIIGAGLVGSVLAKEARVPSVSDFLSGAYKMFFKQLKQDNSTMPSSKKKCDTLMQQVDSLRKELNIISNRSITIVTGNQSGSGKYAVTVVVVVVGYGYVWWKGWRFTDLMFATRRGLNDACTSIAKQLEIVYSSISATKKHLSSRIDRVDCKIDECVDNAAETRDKAVELADLVKLRGAEVRSVHDAVRSLETKISRIEVRQDVTNLGVGKLLAVAGSMKNVKLAEPLEGAASRPALELPKVFPSRAVSLPSNTSLEPLSPTTSNGSHGKHESLSPSCSSQRTVSDSGLKVLHGLTDGVGMSSLITPPDSNGTPRSSSNEVGMSSPNTPPDSNETRLSEEEDTNSSNSPSVFGRTFSNFSFLSRSRK